MAISRHGAAINFDTRARLFAARTFVAIFVYYRALIIIWNYSMGEMSSEFSFDG